MKLREFFSGKPTATIAQQLLGKKLTYQTPQADLSGWIVETEAYLGQLDSTAHAHQGHRSPANEALYGPPGMIYIFSLRGWLMLNFITQPAGIPQGILLRGIEPVAGQGVMEHHRHQTGVSVTNGPGKLTQALGITDRRLNQTMLNTGALQLTLVDGRLPQKITCGPRIGVSQLGSWTEKPLRFFVAGNPYVSQQPKKAWNLTTFGWCETTQPGSG